MLEAVKGKVKRHPHDAFSTGIITAVLKRMVAVARPSFFASLGEFF